MTKEKTGQDKPTDLQVKKFWEGCGLEYIYKATNGGWYYYEYQGGENKPLPPIDLNNLFKYAVPLAIKRIMKTQGCNQDFAYKYLFEQWLQLLYLNTGEYEDALFWVLDEVRKGQ